MEIKEYIERNGEEFWKEEITSFVNNRLQMSGCQAYIDNETMQNIVNELMQDKRVYDNISWLNILITWACNNNGITL